MSTAVKEQFLSSTVQQPLFAARNTRIGLDESLLNESVQGANLYFGTGLTTSRGDLTAGLPFDFLGMMLSAEWTRRQLGLGRVIQEISDTHACAVNPDASPDFVVQTARAQKAMIERIAGRLGLQDRYEVVLASTYQATPEFQAISAEVGQQRPGQVRTGLSAEFLSQIGDNEYFRLQWAGMTYLRRERNVQVKLSWLMEDDDQVKGYDERAFDRGFLSLGKDNMSFVYVYSGLTFDTARNFRVIPYTAREGEQRLMLQDGEDASRIKEWLPEGWPKNQAKKGQQAVVNRMENIVSLFAELFPNIPVQGETVTDRVNFILRDVCGLSAPGGAVGEAPRAAA